MQPAENLLKTTYLNMSVMKNQSKKMQNLNLSKQKCLLKIQKTQFENAKTQKTAQVLAQVFLDRR